jgi:hypothetical protein
VVGQGLGRAVGERVEAAVGLELAHLGGHRIGDLPPAVADRAVPEAGHPVDELVAVGVPQQRSAALHDADELLAGGLGERMEEGRRHDCRR